RLGNIDEEHSSSMPCCRTYWLGEPRVEGGWLRRVLLLFPLGSGSGVLHFRLAVLRTHRAGFLLRLALGGEFLVAFERDRLLHGLSRALVGVRREGHGSLPLRFLSRLVRTGLRFRLGVKEGGA